MQQQDTGTFKQHHKTEERKGSGKPITKNITTLEYDHNNMPNYLQHARTSLPWLHSHKQEYKSPSWLYIIAPIYLLLNKKIITRTEHIFISSPQSNMVWPQSQESRTALEIKWRNENN